MKRICSIIIFILLSRNVIFGQLISGYVTLDNYNVPADRATVYIRGTNISTVVDTNGYFQIETDSLHKILGFSYIGCRTVEIDIENRTVINVSLEDSPIEFRKLIITGYFQPKKPKLTGMVTKIDGTVTKTIKTQEGSEAKVLKIEKSWEGMNMSSNWIKYIYDNINYSDSAILNGIEGTVYTKFTIDTSGLIKNIIIIRNVAPILDNYVLNELKSVPKLSLSEKKQFGNIYGRKYIGIYYLPIRFEIKKVQQKKIEN